LRTEHHLAPRERPEHEGSEVAVFSEKEEVLLVQRVDDVLRVVLDDVGIGEDGDPVAIAALRSLDAVHWETTGKTGDTAEHRLESLSEMVRDVVLEDCGREGWARRRKRMGEKDEPWIIVTQVSLLLAIFVSPHKPMISGSWTMHETILETESGKILVSASTINTTS
jgi:hypothetical protein